MNKKTILKIELFFAGSPLIGIPTKTAAALWLHNKFTLPTAIIVIGLILMIFAIIVAWFRFVKKKSLFVRLANRWDLIEKDT